MKSRHILTWLFGLVMLLGGCASAGPSVGGRSDVMINIPEGWFSMGMNRGDVNEKPEHRVFLSAYAIDKYEVSAKDFARFLTEKGNPGKAYFSAGDYSTIIEVPPASGAKGNARYEPRKGYENYPANNVSWVGADAYCRWKGERLPTEAEWEKAARGDDGRVYPWGDDGPDADKARFGRELKEDGLSVLTPVDSMADGVSYYGLFNMSGNVVEWVNDWYRQNYYEFCDETAGDYLQAAAKLICIDGKIISAELKKTSGTPSNHNPGGPFLGSFKVLRGGSWRDRRADLLTSPHRFWLDPEERHPDTGFRCVAGGEETAPVATPAMIRKALADCKPEKVATEVVRKTASSVPPEEVMPAPVIPKKKVDIVNEAIPQVVEKPPCPPEFKNVFFATDSYRIPDDAKPGLRVVAEWLKKYPGARMRIEGHTDDRGTERYNLVLSEKRAKAIKYYLVKLGVSKDQLDVKGYGEDKPLCNKIKTVKRHTVHRRQVVRKRHTVRKRPSCPLPKRFTAHRTRHRTPSGRKRWVSSAKQKCRQSNRRAQLVTEEKKCRK